MTAPRRYRPSNGTEGEQFITAYCCECARDAAYRRYEAGEGPPAESCPILCRSFVHDVDDPEYPAEWVYDEDGTPTCTAFTETEPAPPDHPDQTYLFPEPKEP